MTLSIVDPGMVTTAANYYLDGLPTDGFGPADWTDSADPGPTFDTQHVVFTSAPQDSASQDAIGDNSNGLQNMLHLVPSLTYAYTSGYSDQHTTSEAITASLTQSLNYQFIGPSFGGGTTFTASGTYTTSDAHTDTHSTTITSSIQAPFDVPAGKIYEEKLLFSQGQAQVPFVITFHVDGQISAGSQTVGTAFGLMGDYARQPSPDTNNGNFGYPVPSYKDVNWADATGPQPGNPGPGTYVLHGTLTMYAASTAYVKIYDITNQTAQDVSSGALVTQYAVPDAFSSSAQGVAPAQGLQAAAPSGAAQGTDPAQGTPAAVGVDHIMDNAGRTFFDTPNDDLITGGAGDDHIFLSGGQDITHAGAGNDTIVANGDGGSLLDGGAGDDTILLASTLPFNALEGGDGNDFLQAYAPYSMVYGGPGDDTFLLREDISGGSVITDSDGANKLFIRTAGGDAAQLGFERISGSDNLYILLGGDQTYNRDHDVVWANFFADPDNQINGLSADQVAALAHAPPPASAIPSPALATGTTGATGAVDAATGLVVPTGMNQTLFSDADQLASAANLTAGQEQALVIGANAISKVLTEFPTVLQFVAPDVLRNAIADLLHATSPISDMQSQALAGDIIANPYAGGMSSVAQPIPTPSLIGADSTNLNTVGDMIFALAHT